MEKPPYSVAHRFTRYGKKKLRMKRKEAALVQEPESGRCFAYLRELSDPNFGMILPVEYQKKHIDDYIARSGKILVSTFTDKCASDTNILDQVELEKLLDVLERGDTLVALDFNYLSFNHNDLEFLVNCIYTSGCNIYTILTPVSSAIIVGKFVMDMSTLFYDKYAMHYRLAHGISGDSELSITRVADENEEDDD